MKRLFLVFIVLASLLATSCTPAADPAGSSPADPVGTPAAAPVADSQAVAEVITQLEKDWAAAIVRKDTATLDRLLSDDFNGTSPTAHTYPKTAAIEDIETGTYVVETMDLDEISVNVYGDTAVAFTSQKEKSKYAGEDTGGHYHYTDVWIRNNDAWQVVASHGSRYLEDH